jgi:hypothetical protein
MRAKFTNAKNHAVGIGAIFIAFNLVLASHSPENPITIYSWAPVVLAIGQYLISLVAHRASPPNQITAPQVNLIHQLAQERNISQTQLCEWTNQAELCDLTRTQGTVLIQKIKSLPRKRKTIAIPYKGESEEKPLI